MIEQTGWEETPFDAASIDRLNPEKRTEMIRIAIKGILDQHKKGLTAQDITEMTGLSIRTVRKHLDFLTAVREAYKKEYRTRLSIYFPNGRLVHPYSDHVLNIGNSLFSLQRIENIDGKFIYIQERKKDRFVNKTTITGGILVERENMAKFITELEREIEEWQAEDEGINSTQIGR